MNNLSNLDKELRRKIDDCWGRDTEKKVVDEKLPNTKRVPGEKPMLYDWGLKKRESWARHKMWNLVGRLEITCSHVQLYVMSLKMSNVEVIQICRKTLCKSNAAKFFLAYLLMLLASWPHFDFVAIGLTVGLAIGDAISIASEVAICLSR